MRVLILMLLVFLGTNGLAHKHYVSITDMEWKADEGHFEASVKLTAHDFEHLLEDEGLPEFHIEKMTEGDEHYKKTMKILTQNFRVYAGEEQCEIVLVGWEVNKEDELFFYLKFIPQSKTDFKEVTVAQNLMFSKFSDQQNIVHFKNGEELKSETLVADKTKAVFKL